MSRPAAAGGAAALDAAPSRCRLARAAHPALRAGAGGGLARRPARRPGRGGAARRRRCWPRWSGCARSGRCCCRSATRPGVGLDAEVAAAPARRSRSARGRGAARPGARRAGPAHRRAAAARRAGAVAGRPAAAGRRWPAAASPSRCRSACGPRRPAHGRARGSGSGSSPAPGSASRRCSAQLARGAEADVVGDLPGRRARARGARVRRGRRSGRRGWRAAWWWWPPATSRRWCGCAPPTWPPPSPSGSPSAAARCSSCSTRSPASPAPSARSGWPPASRRRGRATRPRSSRRCRACWSGPATAAARLHHRRLHRAGGRRRPGRAHRRRGARHPRRPRRAGRGALAERGHFPAIDVLASVSRVMPRVAGAGPPRGRGPGPRPAGRLEQQPRAGAARRLPARERPGDRPGAGAARGAGGASCARAAGESSRSRRPWPGWRSWRR